MLASRAVFCLQVASAQELAEVWEVAWLQQRAGEEGSDPSDDKGRAVRGAPVLSLQLLSFSGFLDFLGR